MTSIPAPTFEKILFARSAHSTRYIHQQEQLARRLATLFWVSVLSVVLTLTLLDIIHPANMNANAITVNLQTK